jgi:hypothetical protein
MFVGKSITHLKYLKTALNKTKHLFIPQAVWVNGLLSNPYKCFYSLLTTRASIRNKNINFLIKLKKRIDLVVVLDELNCLQTLKEGFLKKVPTISFNSDINNPLTKNTSYRMYGNYNFIEKQSTFFSILISILKRKLIFIDKRTKEEIKEESMTMEERWDRDQKKIRASVFNKKNYYRNKNKHVQNNRNTQSNKFQCK